MKGGRGDMLPWTINIGRGVNIDKAEEVSIRPRK